MLTEKVVFCIVMVPTLWIGYGCMLYFFTGLDVAAIALAILSMPLFA
jgi:glycerol-3-phosphate O-acyltransferase/dihydroxyacetone phosphate acyltransferase